jgi:hypothetical protein
VDSGIRAVPETSRALGLRASPRNLPCPGATGEAVRTQYAGWFRQNGILQRLRNE